MNKLIGYLLILLGVVVIGVNLWHIFFTEGVFKTGCVCYMVIGALVCFGGVLQLNEEKKPWED